MENLDRLAGRSGMVIIDGTADNTTLSYDYMIVREASTLTSMTGKKIDGGTTIDLKATQNWDGSLVAGDELIPPSGYVISQVKMATGSVKAF